MNWGSVGNFLQMGGYAGYVWGAYVVTTVLIATEIVMLRTRRRRAVQDVAQRARSGVVEG
ncbi:MAG TPA: heme exporter protein CcmD [Burkholderiaceae bacterium]|nr:heme exporter protein CcmD [Burkholderiaceae bacterium]